MIALAFALSLVRPGMTVRTSETDITAPEPLLLGGYTARHGQRSIPGGDRLFARTLILQQGPVRVAIVSLEMLTVPESLVKAIAGRLPDDIRLFVAAVHTHSAPDSQMLNDRMTFSLPGISPFSQKWMDWYSSRIAGGVLAALASPPEGAKLSLRQGQPSLNRPRRKDGTPDPIASELDAGSRVLLTEYAAHATIYGADELHTRGDWPGAVGALTHAPVIVGAIGDVSPAIDGTDPAQRVAAFRDRLLEKSFGSKPSLVIPKDAPFNLVEEPIPLDPPEPNPDFIKSYGVPRSLAQMLIEKFAPPEAHITAIRIGDLAIVGVPGEPTGVLGLRIAACGKKLGFHTVLVCSHVNGWIGYILEPADYDRGGYEATLSFHGRQTGEHLVAAASAALKRLRQ